MIVNRKHPETGELTCFASINDVARICGVSRSTVERQLRDKPITRLSHGKELLVCMPEYVASLVEPESALERKRQLEAEMLELKLLERKGTLVQPHEIRAGLMAMAALLRKAGDALGRKFGPEAQLILNEALEDAVGPACKAIDEATNEPSE